MKKILLIIFLITLFLSGFIAIAIFTGGISGKYGFKTLWTTAIVSFYSLVGMCGVAHLERSKTRWFGMLVIGLCFAFTSYALLVTWEVIGDNMFGDDGAVKSRLRHIFWAMALAHSCLVLLIKARTQIVTPFVYISIACVVFNTLILTSFLTGSKSGIGDSLTLVAILSVIAICSTIAAPTINLMFKKPEDKALGDA